MSRQKDIAPNEAGFQLLLDALDRSGIHYMVGRSLASSFHGIPRSTNDVDIVADIKGEQVPRLVSEIEGSFYADAESIHEALQRGRSFNVIHFASGDKFDVFPVAGSRFSEIQLKRSTREQLSLGEGASIQCPVATAEDTILAKLLWYRLGGEQSERQWNDMRGIRAVQGEALDQTYMQQWTRELKVDDLLERLFAEQMPE